MRQHRIVAYAGMLLLTCIVWVSTSRPLAWAQAPSDAAIFVDRAILDLDEHQYDQALQELREALRLDPNSVATLFYQGLVYAAMNRPADAAAAWE
jgi:Tfp pilus assembly protein PilF